MGDLQLQTAVTPIGAADGDGTRRFGATVHRDWEIWGPEGGYVAAIALRAAGQCSPFARPASFFCHYLAVADFDEVELTVTPLRSGRTVLSQRVEMTQGGRTILSAMVWSVGQVDGLAHDDTHPPEVPDPEGLPTPRQLWPDQEDQFNFWSNFDQRPIDYFESWPPPGPVAPTWRTWVRCLPESSFDDPWVDAARTLIVLDVMSWPAGSRPHAYSEPPFIAPSLDLYASFLHPGRDSEWLLLSGHSPVAADGLMSWTGQVWSRQRRLIASGGGQAVFRHT
ncbi:MAG TPA: thioesterase family protein [Acidimicrobiales bacterium]|jgi:acyl-CoA thioesterase-2|nr:thioesterase family protein [Acidimicrobiales bacterium]